MATRKTHRDKPTAIRPIEAIAASVGILGAIITIATLPLGAVVAQHPLRSAVALVCFGGVAVLVYWLWRGVVLGRRLEGRAKIATGAMAAAMALATWLVLAPVLPNAGEVGLPEAAAAATPAEGALPYGLTDTENIMSYDVPGSDAGQNGDLRTRYYLASDPQFLQAMLERKSPFWLEGAEPTSEPPPFTEDADAGLTSMIDQLLDPAKSSTLQNEPYRFMSMVWSKYLTKRKPAGKLSKSFESVKAAPKGGSVKKGTWDEWQQVLWFETDNHSMLEGSWFDLDPLTKQLAQANPEWQPPLAKAGAIKWKNVEECGDGAVVEGGPDVIENAFIVPRKVKLLLLDVQNVSDKPVQSITLNMNSRPVNKDGVFRLLTPAQARAELAEQPYTEFSLPNTVLRPGEHMVIPLSVAIGEMNDQNDYEPGAARPLAYFGPAVHVRGIRYEAARVAGDQSLSEFDETKLTMVAAGLEGGASCPRLYTRRSSDAPWVSEGSILVGANGVARTRHHGRLTYRFDGTAQIREEEWETTHLLGAVAQGTDARGNRVDVPAVERFPILLDRGQAAVLTFPGSEGLREVSIILEGYYVPYPGARTYSGK